MKAGPTLTLTPEPDRLGFCLWEAVGTACCATHRQPAVNAGVHLVDGETVYLTTLRLQRDWPRNVLKNGHVDLDVGGRHFTGHAK